LIQEGNGGLNQREGRRERRQKREKRKKTNKTGKSLVTAFSTVVKRLEQAQEEESPAVMSKT